MKRPLISHYGFIAELSSFGGLQLLVDKVIKKGSDLKAGDGLFSAVASSAPDIHRLEDFKHSEKFYNLSEGSFDFSNLDGIANRLLEFNGSSILFRHREEDEAQTVSLQIHPYILAAKKTANLLRENVIVVSDVKLFAQNITPNLYRDDNQHREYADNHIHLNGSHSATTSILERCNAPFYECESHKSKLPEISRLRSEESCFEPEQIFHLMRASFELINSFVLKSKKEVNLNSEFSNKVHLIHEKIYYKSNVVTPWPTWQKSVKKAHNNSVEANLLCLAMRFYDENNLSASLYCYYTLLFQLDHEYKNNECLSIAIRLFLVSSNILRNHIVMSSKTGLNYFTDFFSSSFSKIKNKTAHGYTALESLKTDYSEVKISPWDASLQSLKEALSSHFTVLQKKNRGHRLLENGLEVQRLNHQRQEFSRGVKEMLLHFVIHFIKEHDKLFYNSRDLKLKPVRHEKLRKKVRDQAFDLNKLLSNPSNQEISLFDILLGTRYDTVDLLENKKLYQSIKINLNQLLVGLDAAGNECDTPPEVFAPALRYLRRMPQALSSQIYGTEKHPKKFRLSMHAGEDFNHIVTGIRRIDETVLFCEYGQFDRLGHALAIGLNPKDWFKTKQEVLVTREEYFDNMVWLWNACDELSLFYPKASSFKSKYERMIISMASELYGDHLEGKVDDFYEAWMLRRNCPLLWENQTIANLYGYEEFIPDFDKKSENPQASDIFEDYHYDYSQNSNKRNEVISIRYGDKSMHNDDDKYYFICDEELELYEALQDFLITRYEKKGIIIEACPTSNITIGSFEIKDHPIFRWHPPKAEMLESDDKEGGFNRFGLRKGIMSCCINTDDPGIFPTTIQNEHKLLKSAAIEHHGCTETGAENWVESLRKNGVDIFMRNWCQC